MGQPPKDAPTCSIALHTPRPQTLCRECGKNIVVGRIHCASCSIEEATERLADVARLGRIAARMPEARAKHVASRKRNAQAQSAWDGSSQPSRLTADLFSRKIQPKLSDVATSVIRSSIGVSRWYASRIRQGYRPHPRHWLALANLVSDPKLSVRHHRAQPSRKIREDRASVSLVAQKWARRRPNQ